MGLADDVVAGGDEDVDELVVLVELVEDELDDEIVEVDVELEVVVIGVVVVGLVVVIGNVATRKPGEVPHRIVVYVWGS